MVLGSAYGWPEPSGSVSAGSWGHGHADLVGLGVTSWQQEGGRGVKGVGRGVLAVGWLFQAKGVWVRSTHIQNIALLLLQL